jgi:hypothetical protein
MEVDHHVDDLSAQEEAQEKGTRIPQAYAHGDRQRRSQEAQAEGKKETVRLKTAVPVVFFFQ